MNDNPKNLPTDVIPKGSYCYSKIEVISVDGKMPRIKLLDLCPYWGKDPNLPEHENGTCEFMGVTDEDLGMGLLWDQCKECGINDDYDEEEDYGED